MAFEPEKLPKETKQVWILAVLAMACIAIGVTYLFGASDAEDYRQGWLIILLGVALAAVATWVRYRATPGNGEIEQHDWSTVLTDKSQLLVGRHLVALGLYKPPRFPRDSLRGLVLARLPQASYAKRWQVLWTAARRGNVPVIVGAVGLAFFVVSLLLLHFNPQWHAAIRTAVFGWVLRNFNLR